MIRLLGDMRSYNYVIVPTHDFDQVVYKIRRAIDFDQQCYEGKFKIYRPQFLKKNNLMVDLVSEKFQKASIYQYKLEERSTVAKRMLSYKSRANKLLDCMINDRISTKTHVKMLKETILSTRVTRSFWIVKIWGKF